LEPALREFFLVASATSRPSLRLTKEPLKLILSVHLDGLTALAECNDLVKEAVVASRLVLFSLLRPLDLMLVSSFVLCDLQHLLWSAVIDMVRLVGDVVTLLDRDVGLLEVIYRGLTFRNICQQDLVLFCPVLLILLEKET
jgi:hypothetical protein